MGSTNITNAASRTTITIMEGDMSWEDLYKELAPNIPFDKAKTVGQVVEEARKKQPDVTENFVRDTLEKMVKNNGWIKRKYRNVNYYWPPDQQK
jgi:hypothetical protein